MDLDSPTGLKAGRRQLRSQQQAGDMDMHYTDWLGRYG